jgi:hypothetical protein
VAEDASDRSDLFARNQGTAALAPQPLYRSLASPSHSFRRSYGPNVVLDGDLIAGPKLRAVGGLAANQRLQTKIKEIVIGLAASLSRPGGNLTGIANVGAEIAEKRLELLTKWCRPLNRLRPGLRAPQ